ncbi:protein associated with UVRAG as autophagy enhancer [Centroberyx affinis]|uniref:protein associated with UVRAG as autophagy enhancer n=1 Tax=Centroberyx affinis TaxID=166261 RepID=UPI003A5BBE38
MESCRGVSSALHRSSYVSWCADSAESAPLTPALTSSGTPEGFSNPNQQSTGGGPIPLLLLSVSETTGGLRNPTLSHQPPQTPFARQTHHGAYRHSQQSQSNPHSRTAPTSQKHRSPLDGDENVEKGERSEEDEGVEGGNRSVRLSEADCRRQEDPSLLHPDVESFHLPRSSPVISRRRRSLSWHGGDTDRPSSLSSRSPSPAPGAASLGEAGGRTALGLEVPAAPRRRSWFQEDKTLLCVSVSSNLNRLLSVGLHLPFRGQQGSAEERRGRGQSGSDARPRPVAQHPNNKDKRSSDIPECSADIFRTSCELEKENAHFVVVDMVLEVLEGAKWTLSLGQQTSTDTHTHRHTHHRTCTHRHTGSAADLHTHEDKRRSEVDAHTSKHTHEEEEEEEQPGNDRTEELKKLSVLSTDSGFEDCGVDSTLTLRDSLRNGAERLAQQLVLGFRRSWLPSQKPRRGRTSLRTSLQELPGTAGALVSSGSLTDLIRLRTRMRGTLSWAPPRFQIIFTVQPTHRRSDAVALQHFLCAGCGTEVEPRYIKKLRYCEYLGKYFCDCCHSGSEAVIPGRVLTHWDFSRFPVSDFSKQLLESVWQQPLFDLTCVGKTLYGRVRELGKFRELQEQLLGIKKLLTACRLSDGVMTEFEHLPGHLSQQPHLFSLDDLLMVKRGQLVPLARAVLLSATEHVRSCELCLARGFICEFCRKRDVIFPFQSDICKRCAVCKACFHKTCFMEKKCPKCQRIQSRRKVLDGASLDP